MELATDGSNSERRRTIFLYRRILLALELYSPDSPNIDRLRDAVRSLERKQFQADYKDAFDHGYRCLDARGDWCVETLGHNIQSNCFLDADTSDRIAAILLDGQ